MNAADGIAALHWWEQARRFVTRANVLVVGCATVVLVAYFAGRSQGIAKERARTADSVRTVLADSSKAIEQRLEARAPVVAATAAKDSATRVVYREAKARVAIVSDTVLRVDSVLVTVPMPVIQVIARADSVIVADSIAYRAVAAQLADMTKDRDTWRERAQVDEAQHGSRFGFKSGVVAGAALVGGILHFIR